MKWRRRRRDRNNASNSPDLPIAKPRPLLDERREDHEAEVVQIRVTRQHVWRRSRGVCECCGTSRQADDHEMNEDPPRSATRGLPPAQRFNLGVCIRLCRECHRAFHAKLVRFVKRSVFGFSGAYLIERRATVDDPFTPWKVIDRANGRWP